MFVCERGREQQFLPLWGENETVIRLHHLLCPAPHLIPPINSQSLTLLWDTSSQPRVVMSRLAFSQDAAENRMFSVTDELHKRAWIINDVESVFCPLVGHFGVEGPLFFFFFFNKELDICGAELLHLDIHSSPRLLSSSFRLLPGAFLWLYCKNVIKHCWPRDSQMFNHISKVL